MSHTSPSSASQPHTVEEGINAVLHNANKCFHQRLDECRENVRASPTTSMLTAAAAGYCLHHLPVRAIVVANVRLLSALVPPALFLFGAAKMYEFLQREAAETSKA